MPNKQSKYIDIRTSKKKLYETNAAIWYNKACEHKQLTPNYISININETSSTPIVKATEGLAKMRVAQVLCLFEQYFEKELSNSVLHCTSHKYDSSKLK
jgi:hypothetical protein